MPLPDVHPDGDPFAARDAEREANSFLGKLEARAQLEEERQQLPKHHRESMQQQQQQDAPSSELVSSPAPATRKPPATPSTGSALKTAAATAATSGLGTDSNGKRLIVIESTDDEAGNDGGPEPDTEDGLTTAAPSEAPEPNDQDTDAAAAAASGPEDEEEEEEEEAEATGTEADEGSEDDDDEDDGTPQVDDVAAEDESEEESDDDSDDDDTNSMTSERAPRIKDGEIEGEVVGPDGVRLSPKKKAAGEDGDVEMRDGEGATPGKEGADGAAPEKKKRRRRAPRTPTPPPLAPKERRATVRLSIALPPRKDDSAPDFNIQQLAKDAGFVKEDEPEKAEDEEDDEGSESDGQGGRRNKAKDTANGDGEGTPGANGENEPPKKRRKRGPNVVLGRFGGYDVNDPFVDDEEVALYEPRYTAKPFREGYFVCAGEVDVAARRGRVKGSKNKPKVDENGNPVAPTAARRRSGKIVLGADGKPVADTPEAGPSGAHSPAVGALPSFGAPNGPPPPKQRKKGEFSPELQEKLDMLKAESDKEPWIVKNKFPPALKDKLVEVAHFALDIGEYDEEFYNVMPKIFPYNLFTMKKLIKREVYPKRIRDLNEEQDEQLQILKQGIDRNYGPQRADFERRLAEYERKLAQGDGTTASGVAVNSMRRTPEPAAGPIFGHSPAIATPLIATVDGLDGSPAPGKEEDEKTKEVEEPKWRFRLDESMRAALYRASEIEDKKSELTVEKQELEKATTRTYDREKPYSSKTARKVLYEKILELWPPGAMNSNLLSREISNYKLKLKKHGDLPSGPGP